MLAIADWTYFTGGGLLAIVSLALLCFALLYDRSRGRRRCPKCWYDMSGSPASAPGVTCSECGFTAKRESQLYKTRRRFGYAVLAVAVLALAGGVAAVPKVKRDGWTFVPTTVLILAWPQIENVPDAREELARRLKANEAWVWQWRWLLSRTESEDAPHLDAVVAVRDRWPADVPLYCLVDLTLSSDLREWRSNSVRVRLASRFVPEAAVTFPGSWFGLVGWPWAPEMRLGMMPLGVNRVEVDLILELNRDEVWHPISERTISFDVDVGGALAEFISLDDAPEATRAFSELLRATLRNTGLSMSRPLFERDGLSWPDNISAPATIELRRDGVVVATWPVWLAGAPVPPGVRFLQEEHRYHSGFGSTSVGSFMFPPDFPDEKRPFGTEDYEKFAWSLHVRGDPARALLDPEAEVAWTDEFELPLEVVAHPRRTRLGSTEGRMGIQRRPK